MNEYQEIYLNKNMGIIGDLFDFVINECNIEKNKFVELFLKSEVCKKIENKKREKIPPF